MKRIYEEVFKDLRSKGIIDKICQDSDFLRLE